MKRTAFLRLKKINILKRLKNGSLKKPVTVLITVRHGRNSVHLSVNSSATSD